MAKPSIDLKKLRVFPLSHRQSLTRLSEVLVNPDEPPPQCPPAILEKIQACARSIRAARHSSAAVILMYGAHLVKNGAASLVNSLMYDGWLTHLATNGAGTIHDWEFAFQGQSTENVRQNVAQGMFGTWEETGYWFHLALLGGALTNQGFGASLGLLIENDGVVLPSVTELERSLRDEPAHPLAPARAELLCFMLQNHVRSGYHPVKHPWKNNSILAKAFRLNIPLTVHPGIGYDIITNHPLFNGAVIGRAGGLDFQLFCKSVNNLDNGVVLCIGSAVMAPQVFEKSMSCVNNLRLQVGEKIVSGHEIFVVDLQDNGGWDWSLGEPPKNHPAYYLRFCKSFSRMGGKMHYVQADNVVFLHNLIYELGAEEDASE